MRWVRAAHESFLATGTLPDGLDPVVAASWRRSLSCGVDPDRPSPAVLTGDDLDAHRRTHPLAAVMPQVRAMLVEAAVADGLVVAVCDGAGRLLWVEGAGTTRHAVERVGFVEGAVWREDAVGTNAPGTALATRRPVQVRGAEHFSRPVQKLSCAAAPVRDLRTGAVLGVIDVTGGSEAGAHIVLTLVRATAASVERELARAGGAARPGAVPDLGADLLVLGPRPALVPPDGHRTLSLRHAEILLLLAANPCGFSAEELAVLLHPSVLSDVAVRAEVSRLRRVVGPLIAGSRPYRLARTLRTDADVVRERLAAGDVAGAVAVYAGPLLPRSAAPGVERLRAELAAEVRAAVLTADADALRSWVGTVEGADDHAAWTRLATLAQPGSPLAAHARAHVAVLDDLLR